LRDAAAAIRILQERTVELEVARQNCEDQSVRALLTRGLLDLATRIVSVAAVAQGWLQVEPERPDDESSQ